MAAPAVVVVQAAAVVQQSGMEAVQTTEGVVVAVRRVDGVEILSIFLHAEKWQPQKGCGFEAPSLRVNRELT